MSAQASSSSESTAVTAMQAASVPAGSLAGVVPLRADERRLSEEQLAAYLSRLGVARKAVSSPCLAALRLLQAAHVDRVAYENLDLHCNGGGPIALPELEVRRTVERVALGERGGYCFLLVDAFAALLCTLGFQVSMHTSGVGDDPLPREKWGNHIVLLVHLEDGRYFISDVGLGDGPAWPFELVSHEWEENGYRFGLEAREHGVWRFKHDAVGAFKGFDVDVSTSAAGAHEFADYHHFYWLHPSSSYRTAGPVLMRVSPEHGILILRSRTFRRVHPSLPGGAETLATAADAAHWYELVRDYFFLSLEMLPPTARASLWEVVCEKHEAWLVKAAEAAAAEVSPS